MRPWLLCSVLLLPLAAGCAMFPGWGPSGSSKGRPHKDVEIAKAWVAIKESFGVDWRAEYVGDVEYQIESAWDEQMAPMYRKGRRRRCTAWLYRNSSGHPYVEVQILREVNTDREKPMMSSFASWEADGRDVEMERRLIRAVDLRLGRVHAAPGGGGRRPSPYRDEETENEKHTRLWGAAKK
jgi:hypothetical protein